MIQRDGDRLIVTVPMLMSSARLLLEQGMQQIGSGQQLIIDLSHVKELDSSSLVVMIAWLRKAALLRSTVKFAAIPAAAISLADLYGVRDLLTEA